MRLSHLAAMATLIALLGAMFVAMGSASAATYMCKVNNGSLEVHDGTNFVVLTVADGKVTAQTGESPRGDDCADNLDASAEAPKAGDQVRTVKGDHDDNDTTDDTYAWELVYKITLGVAKDDKTNVLLTDNPDNKEKGDTSESDTDATRPQMLTIPGITGWTTTGDAADKFENSDTTGTIVEVTDGGTSDWTITAGKAGTATITITDTRPTQGDVVMTYTFEVQDKVKEAADAQTEAAKSPGLKIAFPNDSDGVVNDGTNVKVTITKAGGATLESVTVSGGLDLYEAKEDGSLSDKLIGSRDGSGETTLWVVIPKGEAAGEYTVAAAGKESDKADAKRISSSKVITVGDSGTNVSTASLTLSPLDADGNPTTVAKAQKTQRSSAAADGGKIYLSLAALNSLDKGANTPVKVTVSAPGAIIAVHSIANDAGPVSQDVASKDDSLSFDANGPYITLVITKDTPGSVTVTSIIVDENGQGFDSSDPVDLTFTGVSSEISLGDASGTLLMKSATSLDDDGKDTDKRDVISFSLGAVDKSGNATSIPDVSFQVTDPDGVNVPESKIAVSQGPSTAGLPNAKITLETKAGAATPLDNGEYTIKVSQSATITDTAMFTVVGVGTSVEVEASNMAPDSVGDTVEVTATVADADGNPVADGTKVMFTSSDQTADSDQVLAHVGDRGAQSTKGGMAKATFVAVGDGTSVITAIADGTTGVVVVDSTAGAPEPVVEPEPEPEVASVDCLSNLSGFSTWSCGVDADASAIFDMVSGRGVTAIHLWNGTNWVRYSVDAEGTSIPGSSDFMVTENDILYVSN